MSHIFKNIFPKEDFCDFLKDLSVLQGNKYFFDINLYKKADFNNKITEFILVIEPYYNTKYKYYAERKMNFKCFMTIVRQLCKIHNITYENNIKYCHNSYTIQYLFDL